VIRFVMLSTHYRKPMDWTEKKREEAEKTLRKWMNLTWNLQPFDAGLFEPDPKFVEAIADDLNTHLALVYLNGLTAQPQKLLDHARWLGFLSDKARLEEEKARRAYSSGSGTGASELLASLGQRMDALRNDAKLSKNFDLVDVFKAALLDAGAEVRMSKDGVEVIAGPNFDPTKLEALK